MKSRNVMPAQSFFAPVAGLEGPQRSATAGIQGECALCGSWTPACAGVTGA